MLSISLLMCGREDSEKCLKSLMPFKNNIPCEIVVVDTGCDEKTREIIEKYADEIVNFKWCNDFSKARNVGLKASKGEWFLYLDDDEWFEDPTEIIEFFKSGEYKKYNSACYQQRNYPDYEETSYSDSNVSRMIRLEKDTRFMSSIHEYLYPMKGPVKLFDTYVKHFGYIFKSNKEKYEHSKRNVDLLIDMMKKEPMEFRWDTHILQEYMGIGEMSKLIEVAANGIEKYKRKKNRDFGDRRSLGTFYGYLAEGYGRKFDVERQKKAIEAGLAENDLTDLAKASLYKNAVFMNYGLEKYESCLKAYEHYMSAYEKIGKDKNKLYEQGGLLVGDTFTKIKLEDAILHGIMAAAKTGQDDIVERDFYKLGWEDDKMLLHPDFQGIVIKRIIEAPFKESYIKMAKTMAERKNNIASVVKVLQEIEKEYKENADEEHWNKLIELFVNVESDHWYITYLKLLKASKCNEVEKIEPLFDKLCSHVFDIFNLDDKLWEIAEAFDINMEAFFLRIDYDMWRDGIVRWINGATEDDLKYKEKLVRSWKRKENVRYDFFFMKIKEGKLLHCGKDEMGFTDYEGLVDDYVQAELEYHARFYKKKTFQTYTDILPHECRFAVGFADIISKRREDNSREILSMVKVLIDVYPPMNETIKTYITKYGEYVKELGDSQKSEMEQLADNLKSVAEKHIKEGNKSEALNILKQLLQYYPKDKEIITMIESI